MAGQFAQFAVSLGAVAALVMLAHFLGLSGEGTLASAEEAHDLLRLAPSGFEPVAVALDREGRGAIARDRQGRFALLVPHGRQFVARVLSPAARISASGDILQIESAIAGERAVILVLGDSAADWARDGGPAS